MQSIVSQLKKDFSQFTFIESDDFLWSYKDNTVFYDSKDKDVEILLLHEISHGLLEHQGYSYDVELLSMEGKAWDKATELANAYNVAIDEEYIQSNLLDTYRDWLHLRSTCPKCKATGVQINKNEYHCLVCNHKWRVNEARTCNLRRYDIKK